MSASRWNIYSKGDSSSFSIIYSLFSIIYYLSEAHASAFTTATDRPLRVKSAAPAARKFRAEPNLTAASQRRGKWK